MVKIYKTAQVEFSCQQMYDLVCDVNRYHEFVMYCSDSRILSETDEMVRAYLEFSLGGFKQRLTTVNRLKPYHSIAMRVEEGPFRYLKGEWRFEAIEEKKCRVSLSIEFEISSMMVNMVLGPIFTQTAEQLVFIFVERARQEYA